jgi:hypothetical protein
MQTLLLFTIVGSLAACDVLVPVSLVAQSPAPVTKTATTAATKPATPAKGATGKPASATRTAGTAGTRGASGTAHGGVKQSASATPARSGSQPAAASVAVGDSANGTFAGALAPTGTISLRSAPDGQPVGSIGPQSTLVAVAHDRGWVRVRTEGWVRETEVAATDASQVTISAADLRADPDGTRGKTVRWDIEVLALATADPLRKGLNPDEPYLLARGPGSESALLYVAVPPSLLALARTVASRAPVPVAIVATVRSGRSEPVGVPILDAQSLVKR